LRPRPTSQQRGRRAWPNGSRGGNRKGG
jgi:hypothetical protein